MDWIRRLLWRIASQTGELRFHQHDQWRQSPDFMIQTTALFSAWGYGPDDLTGQLVVDIGAGSRLRTRYFRGARIAVIEPLAERFANSIEWADVGNADEIYAMPAEQRVHDLEGRARLVTCINVLDHTFAPDQIIDNAGRYLRPDGEFLLSLDLHARGETGLKAELMHPVHVDRHEVQQMLANAGLATVREYEGLVGSAGYGHGQAYTVIARRSIPDR